MLQIEKVAPGEVFEEKKLVLTADLGGAVLGVSRPASELFGFPASELVGRSLCDTVDIFEDVRCVAEGLGSWGGVGREGLVYSPSGLPVSADHDGCWQRWRGSGNLPSEPFGPGPLFPRSKALRIRCLRPCCCPTLLAVAGPQW